MSDDLVICAKYTKAVACMLTFALARLSCYFIYSKIKIYAFKVLHVFSFDELD